MRMILCMVLVLYYGICAGPLVDLELWGCDSVFDMWRWGEAYVRLVYVPSVSTLSTLFEHINTWSGCSWYWPNTMHATVILRRHPSVPRWSALTYLSIGNILGSLGFKTISYNSAVSRLPQEIFGHSSCTIYKSSNGPCVMPQHNFLHSLRHILPGIQNIV